MDSRIKYIILFLFLTSSAFAQRTILRGDMEYYDTIVSKRIERLHIGTTGQILTVASNGLPAWMNASGGGGVPAFPHDSTFFLRGDSTWATVAHNESGAFSGGLESGMQSNTYYGIGRSFENNITNTDPTDPSYGTVCPRDMTLHDFAIYGNPLGPAIDPNIYAVYINGVESSIVATAVVGQHAAYDNTHTAIAHKGDLIWVHIISQPDCAMHAWTLLYTLN